MRTLIICLCTALTLGTFAYSLLLLDDSSADHGMPTDNLNLDDVEVILIDMGIAFYHEWNNWIRQKSADIEFLQDYDIILWYNDNRTINQAEHDTMVRWVNQGNCLIVTGEDSLGSPNDPLMADLIGSTSCGDCPYCESFKILRDSWITDGPFGYYDGTYPLLDYTADQDKAAPKPPTYAVATNLMGEHAIGPAKILVTESNGLAIYWNGNRDAAEWWRFSQTPETVNMFKNMLSYITQHVDVQETSWGQIKRLYN